MKNRERVINAFNHKDSDYIPWHIGCTIKEDKNLREYLNDDNYMDKHIKHFGSVSCAGFFTELHDKPGYFRDEYGVVWNRSNVDKDIGVIDKPQITDITNHDYTLPDIDINLINTMLKDAINKNNDVFLSADIGFSMFERAWSICSMENVLIDMILNPVQMHKLLDDICDYNIRLLDIILKHPVDAVYFGDDWGQQRGLIMGPDNWRKFIKPRIKRMYEKVCSHDKYIIQHSCGDIYEIIPDLIDMGLTCYQTFQPEIYDIKHMKKEFGPHLSFWGGISTQHILPMGTPRQVREETIEIMNIMSGNGGYIASPTHTIPYDVPPQNVMAMLDVFENQDKYLDK